VKAFLTHTISYFVQLQGNNITSILNRSDQITEQSSRFLLWRNKKCANNVVLKYKWWPMMSYVFPSGKKKLLGSQHFSCKLIYIICMSIAKSLNILDDTKVTYIYACLNVKYILRKKQQLIRLVIFELLLFTCYSIIIFFSRSLVYLCLHSFFLPLSTCPKRDYCII